MKRVIQSAALMCLLSFTIACPWSLTVYNDAGKEVNVHLFWGGSFCANDNFYLQNGQFKTIYAGICDLERIEIDGGEGLTFTKQTGNPVGGLKIIKAVPKGIKVIRN